ncbi:MAG: aminopeptidase P N-terminal domain-containing protein [Candidatus Babeliales bacterium]
MNVRGATSYSDRRKELIERVKEMPQARNGGVIVLFAGFEQSRLLFRQESSFYYYTGITEPGVVAVLNLDGSSTLWIPNCGNEREKWMTSVLTPSDEHAQKLSFTEIKHLGSQCVGYQFYPMFPRQEYEYLLAILQGYAVAKTPIFTLVPANAKEYSEQRLLLERLKIFLPALADIVVDISPLVASMRRPKDFKEIEFIYKAIELTSMAQEIAAQTIAPGALECEVQAGIEYIFTGSGARAAFPSIVASGKNGTVLHYHDNNAEIQKGDLVIVDIGAEYNYYCADITRTYPVSGTFTERQRELYDLVLETQEYIASIAKPGYWLSNKEHPDMSLNHLAKKYLQERGYDKYFPHGIGHYLGLDVHDVGDYATPLRPGDVITIEPGIYIPEEGIGIRIEDDYWIVEDGAECLSEYIPKAARDIEALMQEFAAQRKK